jgi:cyanate permease
MTAIQNFGLGAFPWLNGTLRDITGDYVASQIMFASLGIFGFIFAMLLKRADRRENQGLEVPQKTAAA